MVIPLLAAASFFCLPNSARVSSGVSEGSGHGILAFRSEIFTGLRPLSIRETNCGVFPGAFFLGDVYCRPCIVVVCFRYTNLQLSRLLNVNVVVGWVDG